jgi:tight adherence protein C
VIAALLCGAGVGAGLLLTARGLIPTRPPLAAALAALRPHPLDTRPITWATTSPVAGDGTRGLAARLSWPAAEALESRLPGLLRPATRRDLTVCGRTTTRHLAEKLTLALLGLLLPVALVGLLATGGIDVPLGLPLWGSLLLTAAGFGLPDLGVRSDAASRRAEFRQALSVFLDLVVISLSGGAGVETALSDAASVGDGWAFEQLRRALAGAQLHRSTVWTALAQLGEQLGVAELVELAATVGLAGAEGAKVRASLTAKAASLRTHQLTDADADAQATTERMSLPVVLLFAGFLLLIGYPAVQRVLTGL